MDLLLAARRLAMAAVLERDREYQLRYISRWYSKTYSTPLSEVDALPTMQILQAWYEDRYDRLVSDDERESDLREELTELLETDEQRAERGMAKEREEEDAEAFAKLVEEEERQNAEQEAAAKKKVVRQVADPMVDAVNATKRPGPSLEVPGRSRSASSETELPSSVSKLPPDVSISFVAPEDFDRMIEEEQSIPER